MSLLDGAKQIHTAPLTLFNFYGFFSVPFLQNDLIIQIMTESCEIDNLRKNVDDAKMKLATEIKVVNYMHYIDISVVPALTLHLLFDLFL